MIIEQREPNEHIKERNNAYSIHVKLHYTKLIGANNGGHWIILSSSGPVRSVFYGSAQLTSVELGS